MLRLFLLTLVTCLLSMNAGIRAAGLPEKIELPKPTGAYRVGTAVYFWEDPKREEQWTKTPDDHRRLMVQIWYPAAENSPGDRAPYIFELNKIRPSIEKYWEGSFPDVQTHADLNVPVSTAQQQYPVLVLSHGMNSGRFLYTALSEELASRGFIIAAIDHTYWGPGVAFPNGKTVTFDEGMIALDKLDFQEIDRMMLEGITVMAADQAFAAEKLAELNGDSKLFKNKLDLTRMGAIGHSMGGMAATAACLKYTAFKVCISLDGVNHFLNKMPAPSPKPFLLLLNSQWGRDNPAQIKQSYLEAWEQPTVAIINGTRHNSYSDLPLIEPPAEKEGFLEPRRAFQIISSTAAAFLNKHLNRVENENLLTYTELEFIDLRAVEVKEETN